jgi:hypothetical protein
VRNKTPTSELCSQLGRKNISYRVWQVTRKPYNHALAFIATLTRRMDMDELVHEYYSVESFRKFHVSTFKPMTSKHQWQRVNLGSKIKKPKLRRKSERPRVARIRTSHEGNISKEKMTCTECHESGHIAKYCEGGLIVCQKKEGLTRWTGYQ